MLLQCCRELLQHQCDYPLKLFVEFKGINDIVLGINHISTLTGILLPYYLVWLQYKGVTYLKLKLGFQEII